jgi:Na+/H+-dicarboxylate symporter
MNTNNNETKIIMMEETTNQELPKNIDTANENDEHASDEPTTRGGCCAFLHNYPITAILVFATLGLGLGVGLSYWEPDDVEEKKIAIQWIGLAGDLFIRALTCFVLPLVFVNIIIAIVDMMSVGKATSIGWNVISLYLTTTVAAAFFGTMSTLIFMRFYNTDEDPSDEIDSDTMAQVSLSDTVYEGIFYKIIPDNIMGAFAGAEFTAVMFFAIVFGAALAPELSQNDSKLMAILKEMDRCFQRVINWIIVLTPFAVTSLIASGIGEQDNLVQMFSNIGLLMASSFVAWSFQIFFVYIGLFALLTRSNPFTYLKHIIPAQLFAFASASSAATIPTSLQAVKSTGVVPDLIGRFVVPFGATMNMDGGSVYFVSSCVWLAVLNGEEVNLASFALLIIIATMGSIGSAPVPSSGLVLIITAYNTVFGGAGAPHGFAYIIAIDWFMDRIVTAVNVTGDCIVSGIVAHRCSGDDSATDGESSDDSQASEETDDSQV